MTLLVVRPSGQAETFVQALQKLKGRAIAWPLFNIHYFPLTCDLNNFNSVICFSINAVKKVNFLNYQGQEFIAIGPATASYLQAYGYKVQIAAEYNSSGVIALLQANKNYLLLQGVGGNKKVSSYLRQHNIAHSIHYTYAREINKSLGILPNHSNILITSSELLKVFCQFYSIALDTPLIVLQNRMYELAVNYGFTNIRVVNSLQLEEIAALCV